MADGKREDRRGVWAPPANGEYYPTLIIGTCGKCRAVSELEFGANFNFRAGDKVMDRKPIEAWCPRCKSNTEFVPLPEVFQKSENVLGNIQNERLEKAGIARVD